MRLAVGPASTQTLAAPKTPGKRQTLRHQCLPHQSPCRAQRKASPASQARLHSKRTTRRKAPLRRKDLCRNDSPPSCPHKVIHLCQLKLSLFSAGLNYKSPCATSRQPAAWELVSVSLSGRRTAARGPASPCRGGSNTWHATVISAERLAYAADPRNKQALAGHRQCSRARLTLRSRRGPTAGHQARAGGTGYISPARAWRLPLVPPTSNVGLLGTSISFLNTLAETARLENMPRRTGRGRSGAVALLALQSCRGRQAAGNLSARGTASAGMRQAHSPPRASRQAHLPRSSTPGLGAWHAALLRAG